MKKVYKLIDLDCANCALKMERAIEKLDGVSFINVNYITQKMTIEADDNTFDDIIKKVIEACKKIEPNMVIKF